MQVFDNKAFAQMELIQKLQKGKMILCKDRKEADTFLRFLDSYGYRWTDGSTGESNDQWEEYGERTAYGLCHVIHGVPFSICRTDAARLMCVDILTTQETGILTGFCPAGKA